MSLLKTTKNKKFSGHPSLVRMQCLKKASHTLPAVNPKSIIILELVQLCKGSEVDEVLEGVRF